MVRTTMVVAGLVGAAVLAGVAGPAMAEPTRSTDPAVASGHPSRRTALTPSRMADAGHAPAVAHREPSRRAQLTLSHMAAAGSTPGVAHREPSRRTALTLSYMADAGYAAAVKLGCDPATGAHPKKAQACATLAKTGGRPDRVPPARTMCTLIYAPIRADLTGTWRGHRVRWSRTYGNRCEMNRATGVLFQF